MSENSDLNFSKDISKKDGAEKDICITDASIQPSQRNSAFKNQTYANVPQAETNKDNYTKTDSLNSNSNY